MPWPLRTPPPGRFLTLEGIEGSGKTTQAALLANALRKAGHAVTETREPGGTPFAERVRDLLLDRATGPIGAQAELFLYLAARSDHVAERIRPALEKGEWVVCDRFSDATVAYQGYGRGLNATRVAEFLAWIRGPEPDLTVLVDVPVPVGLARAARRGATNRLDREEEAFHQRVRGGYLALAAAAPRRIAVVNGDRPVEMVQSDVLAIVADRLGVALSPAGGASAG